MWKYLEQLLSNQTPYIFIVIPIMSDSSREQFKDKMENSYRSVDIKRT